MTMRRSPAQKTTIMPSARMCSQQGKTYKQARLVEKARSPRRTFRCRLCGRTYPVKSALAEHIDSHLGVRSHKCSVCRKTFTYSSSYRQHMLLHGPEKTFTCDICEQAFKQRAQLASHKARKHAGTVSQASCAECGKKFYSTFSYKRHLRIHSGERPYACSQCGAAFADSSVLRRHAMAHLAQKSDTEHQTSEGHDNPKPITVRAGRPRKQRKPVLNGKKGQRSSRKRRKNHENTAIKTGRNCVPLAPKLATPVLADPAAVTCLVFDTETANDPSEQTLVVTPDGQPFTLQVTPILAFKLPEQTPEHPSQLTGAPSALVTRKVDALHYANEPVGIIEHVIDQNMDLGKRRVIQPDSGHVTKRKRTRKKQKLSTLSVSPEHVANVGCPVQLPSHTQQIGDYSQAPASSDTQLPATLFSDEEILVEPSIANSSFNAPIPTVYPSLNTPTRMQSSFGAPSVDLNDSFTMATTPDTHGSSLLASTSNWDLHNLMNNLFSSDVLEPADLL